VFVLDNGSRLVVPRTELTYPSHLMKLHENAARAPVDHVMADFEDACPYEFKGPRSREVMIEALNTVDFGDKVVVIRPNNVRSRFFRGDLEAVVLGAPDRFHGVILPKTNEPEDVVVVDRLLTTLEEEGGWTTRIAIEALIETPLAVENAFRIATASDRMAGLIFGIADFASAMGVSEMVKDQNVHFHYAKQRTVVAAKAAGLHAIDNAFLTLIRRDTPDEERAVIEADLREKVAGSAALGMDGTWIIHPQQAELSNAAFTPSPEELEEARHALTYYHEQGGGAIYDARYGKFHDEATIKGLLMQLAKGVQAGAVEPAFLEDMARRSAEVSGYDILEMMRRVA
jgi:citrate lyase subunit beta/citryl-CoA lyase